MLIHKREEASLHKFSELSGPLSTPAVGVDMGLFGVSEEALLKTPTSTRFPSGFSKEGFHIWQVLFTDREDRRAINAQADFATRWKCAIKLYMIRCKEQGINPFPVNRNRVDNLSLIDFLSKARHKLITYVDTTDLLGIFKIIRGTTKRMYFRDTNRFTVRSIADAKSPLKNVADLHKLLASFSFVPQPDNSWQRRIASNIRITVSPLTTTKVRIGYEIDGCQALHYPNAEKLPSNAQVISYIEKMIWLPIIRGSRFNALGTHTLW